MAIWSAYMVLAEALAATFARYQAEGWPVKAVHNSHLLELAEHRRDTILEEELCSRGWELRHRADAGTGGHVSLLLGN